MGNVINLLEHPKFLKNKSPQDEQANQLWLDKLTEYFKSQPQLTSHLSQSTVGPTEPSLVELSLASLGDYKDEVPDYLIMFDLLEALIKKGAREDALVIISMLQDVVEKLPIDNE